MIPQTSRNGRSQREPDSVSDTVCIQSSQLPVRLGGNAVNGNCGASVSVHENRVFLFSRIWSGLLNQPEIHAYLEMDHSSSLFSLMPVWRPAVMLYSVQALNRTQRLVCITLTGEEPGREWQPREGPTLGLQ